MQIVIDANELFSLMIKGSKSSKEIFLSKNIELIAPEFILEEFENNKEELLSKTHRTEIEFSQVLSIFKDRIKLIPESEFNNFLAEAENLFPEHKKDSLYLALALKNNCPIWSEEKRLKTQNKIEIFNTRDLFDKLNSSLSIS